MVALKITRPGEKASTGVRPLNLHRDVSSVTSLLEMVFKQQIGSSGRKALSPTNPLGFNLFRQNPAVPGFVYEKEGQVIGNLSLLESRPAGRYLVANIAVHPDFRRQGIARQLMSQVINYTAKRNGRKIVLQVEEDNTGAITLYRNFGFKPIGTVAVWQLNYYHLRSLNTPAPVSARRPDHYADFDIRPLRRHESTAAFQLDGLTYPLNLQWPEAITPNAYRLDWAGRLRKLLTGKQTEIWTAAVDENQLVGLGVIETDWGRPHLLKMRTLPEWQDKVERVLLAKILRRLKYMSRRPIVTDQRKEDVHLEELLREAGFERKRVLMTMEYLHQS